MAQKCHPVTLTCTDLDQTAVVGEMLGRLAEPGDVILLYGDLGVGKTTLTQAIANGLEVPGEQYVTSPSFALLHEYCGRIPLFHMDCYRLAGEDDIEGAGLADCIGSHGLTVIEWPDRLGSLCPEQRLDLTMCAADDQSRVLEFLPLGSSWDERINHFAAEIEKHPLFS